MLSFVNLLSSIESDGLTVKTKLSSNFKDLRYALEMGGETLNEATIEPHARLDEFQVDVLSLSALDMLLLSLSVPKGSQIWSEFLVHFAMSIPQSTFHIV